MNRRILRVTRTALIAITVVLMALGVIAWGLLGTRDGSAWLLRQGALRADARLSYTDFSGSLLHGFEMRGLDAEAQGTRVLIQRLVVAWSPWELLELRLHVQRLGLHHVTVLLPPGPEETGEPVIAVPDLPQVTLPVGIEVDRLELEALRLEAGDRPPALDRLTLALQGNQDHLAVRDLELAIQGLAVAGRADVRMTGDWPVEAHMDAKGSGGDMDLDLTVDVGGAVRAPSLTLEARAPVSARASVDSDLRQHPPRASLTASWQAVSLPGAEPLSSPEGSLRATTRDLGVSLELDAALSDAPANIRRVKVEADARLEALAAPYPLEAELSWGVQSGARQFAGEGHVSGDITRVDVAHALAEPFPFMTRGSITPDGADSRVDLSGDWKNLSWPPDDASAPASPSGSYSVTGTLAALTLDVQAALVRAGGVSALAIEVEGGASPQPPHAFEGKLRWKAETDLAGEVTGSGSARGDAAAVNFRHALSGPGRLDAEGRVALEPALMLEVSGDFADLRWPLLATADQEATARVRGGRFSVEGPVEALKVALDAQAAMSPLGEVDLEARATVTPSGARGLDLAAGLLDGSLAATGRVNWQDAPGAKLTITATQLDPGRLHPQAAGRIDARVDTDVTLTPAGPRGTVHLQSLGGNLGGYPVAGSGQVALVEGGFQAREVSLRTGDNTLSLSGDVGQTLSLSYRLDAPALSQLWPELAGALEGQGEVGGTLETPRVQATLRARAVRAGDTSLASADLDADLDLSTEGRSSLRASAADLRVGSETVMDRALVKVSGILPRHLLEIAAETSEGRLTASAQGGLEGDRWSGELRELSALATPMGDWQLEAPTALTADARGAESGNACLRSGDARLCVQASRPKGSTQSVTAALSALPVERFAPWLPPQLSITGALNAEASARRAADTAAWAAEATLTATPTRLSLDTQETEGPPLQLTLDDTRVEARHDASGSAAHIRSRIGGDGSLKGEVKLGAPGQAVTSLAGRIDASLPDLTPVATLVPALVDVQGRLQAGLDLAGSIQQPRIAGELELADASASVPGAGIRLERTSALLRAGGDGRFSLSGESHSGRGRIALAGEGRLDGDAYTARITVRGEDFEAVKRAALQAFVSPDLVLAADPEKIAVTGSLHVPEATVTIKEVPPDVVQVSDDEIIVGQESPPASAWRKALEVNVDLTLGEKVHISAFGLDTDLRGGLNVGIRGANPVTARGTVSLENGRFKAYGQDLQVQRGRLLFAGPLDNPGLDVRAVRDAGEVVAGIQISGTAGNMRSQVFSEPPLPQADALSWLLTGRGLDSASSEQGTNLAGAAVALGLDGSDQITRKIGAALGLDELTVSSSGTLDESELVLGKSLSPRLYIRYALGVIDGEGTVHLRYKLTDQISVEGESGAEYGGDVLYRLER